MDVSKYKNLPNELRRYRKVLGLSQREAARQLGLKDPTWISHWEHGDALPNLVSAIRLSMLYHVPIDALFVDLANDLRQDIPVTRTESPTPSGGLADEELQFRPT